MTPQWNTRMLPMAQTFRMQDSTDNTFNYNPGGYPWLKNRYDGCESAQ